jgi:ADP-heptose:LPS heptosyltransferase
LHAPWGLPEEIKIEALGPDFDSDSDAFLDCAAAIECCDLIISCDTAIVHLAGALGKPAWVILRHVPHWVWMIDRSDSPWYPSVKLFRQKEPGNWKSVFDEVAGELTKLIL